MAVQILRTLVHAQFDTMWQTLMDSLENLQSYSGLFKECRIVKSDEISVNEPVSEIRREIVEDSRHVGEVAVKVVPTSVQNPMAPVDLQYFVELDPEGEREKVISTLVDEQRRLKEASEKLEKDESRASQMYGKFHHPT